MIIVTTREYRNNNKGELKITSFPNHNRKNSKEIIDFFCLNGMVETIKIPEKENEFKLDYYK